MKAIQIRYLPATDFKGERLKAWTDAGSVTIPLQYDINSEEARALLLAKEYILMMNWDNLQVNGIGQLPDGDWCATLGEKNDK